MALLSTVCQVQHAGDLRFRRLALLQAVHIGDSLTTDIAGGNNVGLKATIWVNRRGLPLPEGAAKPSHIVRHVTELAGLLPQVSGPQLEIA